MYNICILCIQLHELYSHKTLHNTYHIFVLTCFEAERYNQCSGREYKRKNNRQTKKAKIKSHIKKDPDC